MKQLSVVYQDTSVLVVYKPAGFPTQSGSALREDLESLVLKRLQQQGETAYAALINRLDQPVEGMVLFAKNQKTAADLSGQLQNGSIRKFYLAGVRKSDLVGKELPGTLTKIDMEYEEDPVKMGSFAVHELFQEDLNWRRLEHTLLQERGTNSSKVVKPGTKGAKKASLCYAIPARYAEILQNTTKKSDEENEQGEGDAIIPVLIYLETGRHHQIRVQFSASGMPLVGDRKYAPADVVSFAQKKGIRSVALCACRLMLYVPMVEGEIDLAIEPEGDWYRKNVMTEEKKDGESI